MHQEMGIYKSSLKKKREGHNLPLNLAKNFLIFKCHYFDFFTPVTSFLPEIKMTSVKIVDLVKIVKIVSNTVKGNRSPSEKCKANYF